MNTEIVSQDWVNWRYRGFLSREEAYFVTESFFRRCLDAKLIAPDEYIRAMKYNQVAYDNNQQGLLNE